MELTLQLGSKEIFVRQNKETGDAILFIHGNSLCSETFLHQIEAPELQDYRLIAFDWQGHGQSGREGNPEQLYDFEEMGNTIQEVLSELNVENAVIVGHSFGGHLAIDYLNLFPKMRGLVLFGTPPFTQPPKLEEAFLPNECIPLLFNPELSEDQMRLIGSQLSVQQENHEKLFQYIQNTDPMFRAMTGKQIMEGKVKDEWAIISEFNKPLMILHGENDPIINVEYLKKIQNPNLWKNEVQVISGAGHLTQVDDSEAFNLALLEFVQGL